MRELLKGFIGMLFILVYLDGQSQNFNFKDSLEFYYERGNYKIAKEFGILQLEKTRLKGDYDSTYAEALSDLGIVNENLRNLNTADSLLTLSLEIKKKIYFNKPEELALAMLNLGNLKNTIGNYLEAEKIDLEALAIYEGMKITDNYYAILLNNMGLLYSNMGFISKAKSSYLKAASLFELNNDVSISYTAILNNLGNLYYFEGDLKRAEQFLLKSLNLKRKAVPENLADMALTLNNLASYYSKINNFENAEKLIKEAIIYREKLSGVNHPEYATLLGNYANILNETNRKELADSLYHQSLKIIKATLKDNHPYYYGAITNLGVFYAKNGQYNKAEIFFLEAKVLCLKTVGESSTTYANICRQLSRMSFFKGDFKNALERVTISNNFYKTLNGAIHTEYVAGKRTTIETYLKMGDYKNAEIELLEIISIEEKLLQNKFEFLSNLEIEPYIYSRQDIIDLPFKYLNLNKNKQVIEAAYDSKLYFSNIIVQNAAKLATAFENTKDSALSETWKIFKATKTLTNKILTQPKNKRVLNVDSLVILSNLKEKEILQKSIEYKTIKEACLIKWQDIKKALQENEIAIEFVRFKNYKYIFGNPDTIFYGALLLRKMDTTPIYLNLFTEWQLDAALQKFNYKANNTLNSKIASKEESLYNILWKQLLPYLNKIERIYFAPTGKLNNISFAAIKVNNDQFLIDKYKLIQLTSTRQIVKRGLEDNLIATSIAMYGGVNYNNKVNTKIEKNELGELNSLNNIYNQSRNGNLDSFNYLPNTLKEINAIKAKSTAFSLNTKYFSGQEATEQSFKMLNSTNAPNIIHFATHGFTIIDTSLKKGVSNNFKISDNPLLRSGLVLAGGNNGWKGRTPPEEDDGILTGLEISSMDLSNTKLAVLSACETGIGELKGSEGVFGLQRAFKLAGVKHILATLWQIPDKETSEFMTIFYTNLFNSKDIRKSFYVTQQVMRKKYSPYYWAGFTLIE